MPPRISSTAMPRWRGCRPIGSSARQSVGGGRVAAHTATRCATRAGRGRSAGFWIAGCLGREVVEPRLAWDPGHVGRPSSSGRRLSQNVAVDFCGV